MKAIVINGFGGSDRLELTDRPVPSPAEDEVLIELVYTSVNPVDWKIREGMLQTMFPYEFPIILGWDAAGTVKAAGKAVTGLEPGERVFAYCRKPKIQWGTYAEFVTMPAAAVAPIPANLDFAEAATIPLTGLTAWQALFDAAKLKAGDTVLVHAGAGGVGSLAVQFAKSAGATVFTTASARNLDYVRDLGADLAIDYTKEGFAEAVRRAAPDGVDVVFDTVGGDVQRQSYPVLRPRGILVGIVDPPSEAEARQHGARCAHVFVSPNGEQLRRIGELLERGTVKPPAVEEMRLEDAAAAQERSQGGHVRGKIVLRIA